MWRNCFNKTWGMSNLRKYKAKNRQRLIKHKYHFSSWNIQMMRMLDHSSPPCLVSEEEDRVEMFYEAPCQAKQYISWLMQPAPWSLVGSNFLIFSSCLMCVGTLLVKFWPLDCLTILTWLLEVWTEFWLFFCTLLLNAKPSGQASVKDCFIVIPCLLLSLQSWANCNLCGGDMCECKNWN